MAGKRYTEFDFDLIRTFLETEMGFELVDPSSEPGTLEYMFERTIPKSTYTVRIYTTVDVRGRQKTRGAGQDAIRVTLFNTFTHRPTKVSKRINRVGEVQDIFNRIRERARDLWKYMINHRCECGGVMVPRKARSGNAFMGCTNFPACRNTLSIVKVEDLPYMV